MYVEDLLSLDTFQTDPSLFYGWAREFLYRLDHYQPSIVHSVLASMEQGGMVMGVYTQNIDMLHGLIRKAGHVTEYFILGLLLFRAIRGNSQQGWRLRWAVYAVIGVVLYALSDELHQSFSSSRTSSLVDVGIDSAGGVLSQFAIIFREKISRHAAHRHA